MDEITNAGGKAIAIQADVLDKAQVESMVRQVTAELGTIDTVMLNANMPFTIAPLI